jgi:hypothetical protein
MRAGSVKKYGSPYISSAICHFHNCILANCGLGIQLEEIGIQLTEIGV